MPSLISPSMMCANALNLEKDIDSLEKGMVDYLHFDIMDGTFVPNYSLGTCLISALRQRTNIPFDIHLMVDRPENKLAYFDIREGDMISVHYEATPHIVRVLGQIRERGAKACVAVNPGTPVTMLHDLMEDMDAVLVMTVNPGFAGQRLVASAIQKIADLKQMLTAQNAQHILIEVDGNVSYENAVNMKRAGADIFVVGSSSVFGHQDGIIAGLDTFRTAVDGANR